MSAIGKVLADAGILPASAVKQFQRWKVPAVEAIDPTKIPEETLGIEYAVGRIDEALQDEAFVKIKETDLAVLEQYQHTKTELTLHLEDDTGQSAEIPVEVGRLRTGEFVFPWASDGIEEVMINGLTFLQVGDRKVMFEDVRELFFGDNKAFMVCSPKRAGG